MGSCFGWASGSPPRLKDGLFGHLGELLASAIFFAPKRHVEIELAEPDDLPRQGQRVELNSYLDRFYNHEAPPALYVPYSIWKKRLARDPGAQADRGTVRLRCTGGNETNRDGAPA